MLRCLFVLLFARESTAHCRNIQYEEAEVFPPLCKNTATRSSTSTLVFKSTKRLCPPEKVMPHHPTCSEDIIPPPPTLCDSPMPTSNTHSSDGLQAVLSPNTKIQTEETLDDQQTRRLASKRPAFLLEAYLFQGQHQLQGQPQRQPQHLATGSPSSVVATFSP
jgi:hypothetical protein